MNRLKLWTLALCSTAAICAISGSVALAQTFKVGDQVEVDDTGINNWERAVIVPFKPNDTQDGNTYRVRRIKPRSLDDPAGEISQTIHIRHATSAPAATAGASTGASSAQGTAFKVGDLVEVDDTGINNWERAVIVPFKPSDSQDGYTYRVRRTKPRSLDDPAGEISQTIHIRRATSASAATAGNNAPAASPAISRPNYTATPRATAPTPTSTAPTATAGLNPKMNGAFPSIPGTGWDLMGLQKKGEASTSKPQSFAQSFSFCKSGRWSVTRYGLAAGQMGTYTVNGNRLDMINSLNNEPFGNFTMTWRGGDKTLILDSGTYIWTLKLVSLNACGAN